MPHDNPALVTTSWLGANLGRPDLRVVDASWYLVASGRDAAAEFAAGHIPGAVFFDLEASSDDATTLPHMLPRAERFAERMRRLGLSDRDAVVVYDGSGVNLSAPRVWWTFRVFGHPRVSVLDGGLMKWKAEGRPLETGSPAPAPGRYTARLNASLVRNFAEMLANAASGREQVVDTRPAARFEGSEPEVRPGVRTGRHGAAAGAAPGPSRGGRHRPDPACRCELRIRDQCVQSGPRAPPARPWAGGCVRRQLDRMGRADRHAGRDWYRSVRSGRGGAEGCSSRSEPGRAP